MQRCESRSGSRKKIPDLTPVILNILENAQKIHYNQFKKHNQPPTKILIFLNFFLEPDPKQIQNSGKSSGSNRIRMHNTACF